jgi:cytochrome P450
MPTTAELALGELPIEKPEFGRDPMPYFADARRRHGWLARSALGIVLTEYRAMDELLRLDDNLKMPGEGIVEIMGARGTGWGHFAEEMMLARSGADHARLRNSVASAFGPGNVKRLRPVMRKTVTALLDEWAPMGGFDFADFAANFPVRVMFGLIGASVDELPSILSSLEIQGSSFNLEIEKMAVIEEAYQTLWRFVDRLIVERERAAPKGDLLDDLISAKTAGTITTSSCGRC